MGSDAVPCSGKQLTPAVTANWRPSPNFGPRRDALQPELVVLHYTAMPDAEAAISRLCDPLCEVSAHYLISAGGEVTQMVQEDMRAWHAGHGTWGGRDDVNSRSIGIELDNDGASPFAAAQMDALETLLRDIMHRWGIVPGGVIGHSDMAPGRKLDPGPRFDWPRLARQGLAAAAKPAMDAVPADEDRFRALASAAGYPADIDTQTLLCAVRHRFRPWAHGPLESADMSVFPELSG